MLFQEDCGQTDGNHQYAGTCPYPWAFSEGLTFHDSYVGTDGIINVDAGKHIGGCIGPVKSGHHGGEYVLARFQYRSEVCTITEKGADDQADGHAGKQENADPVLVLPVGEQEIENGPCHV